MDKEISQKELEERMAILRRFRTLLEQQRAKFREYLKVLEKQQDSIEKEDASAIMTHTEIEQQVVVSISNLQKVIVPMSEMYNLSVKSTNSNAEKTIEDIQGELNSLQSKVLEQNQKNRALLETHLETIRQQLNQFKNPYKNNRSVYAAKVAEGRLVAIEC